MTFLKSALELADLGFHIFPLMPGMKTPAVKNYSTLATKDKTQIKKWWTNNKNYNIGIATSHYNCSQALVVVDVDDKKGKQGSDELLKLELSGHDFPQTFIQSTPSGGVHLIYKNEKPVKQGESVLASGLDIRSRGGYIVGPGSVIGDKKYEALGKAREIADCPGWIVESCSTPAQEPKEVPPNLDPERAARRAKHYLENEAPIAIEGQNGDATTYKVASRLKDYGVDRIHAVSLMQEYWNDRCQPPWQFDELQIKIDNAYAYGQLPVGQLSPEADFKPILTTEDENNFLENLNQKYAIIFGDGNHTILNETIDEKGRPRRVFMSEVSFKRKFSPKTIQQGKGKPKTWAEMWLDWSKRRTYRGLCFKPEIEPKNNYYNLWRGFTVKPVPYAAASADAKKGLDRFLEHAKQNVCGNDDELFNWLMGYFAHMIQKPYERPLVSLVFQGSKGVGKNALLDRIGFLLGSNHYLVAHDSRYLTSNFNGHLDSCLFFVLDEAFWSGDKKAEGKLKGLTTAPEILIERKGREPYMVDNLARLAIIGNENWLVPASFDERRYAVFKVGEGKKQDRTYFKIMRECIEQKGGAEVLLHYLQTFDLSNVDVNAAPQTQGLLEQKIESLNLVEEFWLTCLQEGHIVNAPFRLEFGERLQRSILRDAYENFCRKKNSKSRIESAVSFGRKLCKMCPDINRNTKIEIDGQWQNAYPLPTLDEARQAMEKYIGQEMKWN